MAHDDAAPDDLSDHIQIDLNVSVWYHAGSVSAEWLKRQLESSFDRAVGDGLLTGASEAEVDTFNADAVAVSRAGASLTEDAVAAYLQGRLESGDLELADIGRTMARYALATPAAMRDELAERMGLDGDEPTDGNVGATPAPRG